MTRTARSSFPRAISKDRSESKSGTDKHMRKDGGGPHGWGRITDEQQLENAAIEDEELEQGIALAKPANLGRTASASSTSEEELESARKFRQNALKGPTIDLASIARTSAAVSTSPTRASPTVLRSLSGGAPAPTAV